MQKFYKGRTNNHLSWVMVDATDFATPESALSAATKIKIYGKLRGATGTNVVSSGTGSLTNDITHVGASALGIYTIALAKADLSDASAAWYDQYIISLSATGAAYQTLVVDGGIDDSTVFPTTSRVLLIQSRLSDFNSAFVSQLSDFRSDLGSFLTTTGVALNASAISDIRSAIAGGPAATVTASDISDIASAVWANTIGARVDSRVLVIKSQASDVYSQLSHLGSDLRSLIGATGPTVSDIASGVAVEIGSLLSDILSAAVQTNSRVLVVQSFVSDIRSHVSDLQSDFQSRVPKRVATDSQLSDLASDVKSAVGVVPTAAVIADAVWDEATAGHTIAASYGDKIGAHEASILKAVLAAGSTTTSIVLNATTGIDGGVPSAVDDFYNGRSIVFTSGALAGQASSIADYVGATKTLTVVALTGSPVVGVTAVIA